MFILMNNILIKFIYGRNYHIIYSTFIYTNRYIVFPVFPRLWPSSQDCVILLFAFFRLLTYLQDNYKDFLGLKSTFI